MSNPTALQLWDLSGCSRLRLAQKADELGVPVLKAIELRTRRVKDQLKTWTDIFATSDDPVTLESSYKEMVALVRELEKLESRPVTQGEIDERMIERAREVPISDLMEFTRNKGLCPFHADKTPSFHYYAGNNAGYCFSCGKYADAIDVYMALHGCNFVAAVKGLNNK